MVKQFFSFNWFIITLNRWQISFNKRTRRQGQLVIPKMAISRFRYWNIIFNTLTTYSSFFESFFTRYFTIWFAVYFARRNRISLCKWFFAFDFLKNDFTPNWDSLKKGVLLGSNLKKVRQLSLWITIHYFIIFEFFFITNMSMISLQYSTEDVTLSRSSSTRSLSSSDYFVSRFFKFWILRWDDSNWIPCQITFDIFR